MRKKPRVRSDMLTINVQALAHPNIGKIHALKSHFESLMQLRDRKGNRRLPLSVLPLPSQRYIYHDMIIEIFLAAAHER